jgi:hypothetical protein
MTEVAQTLRPDTGWDRATEDYLDWLENQRRTRRSTVRRTAGWVGLAVAVTTAVVAVAAFVGRFAGL